MKLTKTGSCAAGCIAGGAAHPKMWNAHRIIRVPHKKPPGVVILRIQQPHVSPDVLVLLPDAATYHLLGGRLPLHRAWPT